MTNWTILNKNTKQAMRFIYNYEHSTTYDICSAYKKPSPAKKSIFNHLLLSMKDKNGFGMKITGCNCFTFNCAYMFKENNKTYLAYITPSYNYLIDLGD